MAAASSSGDFIFGGHYRVLSQCTQAGRGAEGTFGSPVMLSQPVHASSKHCAGKDEQARSSKCNIR